MFSISVAKGLDFYATSGYSGFEHYESTRDFCQSMNDMFDALNRKKPNEGLTLTSNDFKVHFKFIFDLL